MALLVPNEGEVKIISVALGKDAAEDLVLKLYTNDYTPVETSTGTDFTEVSGHGYTAKTLTASDWTVASGAPAIATATLQTFSFTSGVSIYGCYVVGATSGVVYWAERFTITPRVIQYSGDELEVTPVYGLD